MTNLDSTGTGGSINDSPRVHNATMIKQLIQLVQCNGAEKVFHWIEEERLSLLSWTLYNSADLRIHLALSIFFALHNW